MTGARLIRTALLNTSTTATGVNYFFAPGGANFLRSHTPSLVPNKKTCLHHLLLIDYSNKKVSTQTMPTWRIPCKLMCSSSLSTQQPEKNKSSHPSKADLLSLGNFCLRTSKKKTVGFWESTRVSKTPKDWFHHSKDVFFFCPLKIMDKLWEQHYNAPKFGDENFQDFLNL